ncbi:MAG: zinc metallopeptidase [Thermoguttaceae bacterium]|nr:zinc metallopeptidase [Thermoguttaceae bacterium]
MSWLSLVCFLPLIPVFVVSIVSQRAASKTIDRASKTPTGVSSDKILIAFLNKTKLDSIEVVKSSDYLQNEYVEKEGKIFLSPDTLGSVDAASIELALYAGAQADAVRNQGYSSQSIKKLRNAETILFWTSFCLLAFGIMTASISISIADYLVGAIVAVLRAKKRATFKKIGQVAREFVKECDALDEQSKKLVERVLDAEYVIR